MSKKVNGNFEVTQIRADNRHGDSAVAQMSDGSGTSGNVAKFNADGSLTDGGGALPLTGLIGLTIDGGGSVPTTGAKGFVEIPFACTITSWTILADISGSCQITVSKGAYSAFPTGIQYRGECTAESQQPAEKHRFHALHAAQRNRSA